jgi:hypothetical protein
LHNSTFGVLLRSLGGHPQSGCISYIGKQNSKRLEGCPSLDTSRRGLTDRLDKRTHPIILSRLCLSRRFSAKLSGISIDAQSQRFKPIFVGCRDTSHGLLRDESRQHLREPHDGLAATLSTGEVHGQFESASGLIVHPMRCGSERSIGLRLWRRLQAVKTRSEKLDG